MKRKPSRREFLASLGAAAALSPFVPLLNAHGADPLFPKRLILFFTPQGTFPRGWMPTSVTSSTNYTLGPVLAPLAKHQSKINVVAGVRMVNPAYFVAHTPGGVQLWTGSQLDRGAQNADGSYQYGNNTGPSVDQVIAAQLGVNTAYGSLQFGAHTGQTTIFAGPAKPVYPAQDPQAAFKRLFSTLSTQSLSDRQSVLDVVNKQLAGLQPRVSSSDRAKVDAHLTGVRDLERRLQSQSAACKGPTLTPAAQDPTGLAAMLDVMVAAMACDLTRVASMQFGQQDNDGDSYPFLGVAGAHHALTHLSPSDTVDENGKAVSDQTKSVNGQLTKIYTWYASMFAGLLDRLAAVPEGSGTMLDNTLVVWGSELSDPYVHSFANMPFVLAGSAGGALTTGRFLDMNNTAPIHNRLLVSVCNAMGLSNVSKFGNMDSGSGPLPGL